MKFVSKYLGEIEYNEENVFTFVKPLLGFEDKEKFVLVRLDEEGVPYHFFQSLEDEYLTFTMVMPFLFKEDYNFEIEEEDLALLEVSSEEDLIIYSFVVIPEDVKKTRINLMAPVILNLRNQKAMQIILEGDYPMRYEIFQEEDRGEA